MVKIGGEAPQPRGLYQKKMKAFIEDYNFYETYTAKSLTAIKKQLGNPPDNKLLPYKQTN
jgi:hypothetical protein